MPSYLCLVRRVVYMHVGLRPVKAPNSLVFTVARIRFPGATVIFLLDRTLSQEVLRNLAGFNHALDVKSEVFLTT